MIQSNWKKFYYPNVHVSVDERIIGFRVRLNFVLYNPMKPVKYGLRAYVLGVSKNGYTWYMKIQIAVD